MKKVFKALAIAVASTALCAGIATTTACSGGYSGEYYGEYHYTNSYGATYGMVVKVTVENNIITKIENLTNTDDEYAKEVQVDKDGKAQTWAVVSSSWETNYVNDWNAATEEERQNTWNFPVTPDVGDWGLNNAEEVRDCAPDYYKWFDSNVENWTNHLSWLMQQYEGWSVKDVLDVKVYYSQYGEPYETAWNTNLASSGLVVTGSTQGSGRLILAVQDALNK